MDIELRSAQGVAGLLSILPPPEAERALATFTTWGELAAASVADRVAALGARAATVHIPPVCPPADDIGGRYPALSRFDDAFPPQLRAGPYQPLLLWAAGEVPARPLAVIAGTNYPSERARALVGQLVGQLHAAHWGMVALGTQPLGLTAADHALTLGVPVVLAMPTGLRFTFGRQQLLDRVRTRRGAVLSASHPSEPWTAAAAARAERLAVGLAAAVVGLELGATAAAGAHIVQAAGQAGTTVLVPQQLGPVALAGAGVQVFTEPSQLPEMLSALRSPSGPSPAIR